MIWKWAENVNKMSKQKKYKNLVTGKIDENQDNLVNVHLGLDSYEYFSKFEVIAKNMQTKK